MIVVSDTTPIISLMKAGQLELLQKLFGVVYIPGAVYRELTENEVFSREVKVVQECEFIYVEEVNNWKSVNILRNFTGLDAGESEAIILADEKQSDVLLMDEHSENKIHFHLNNFTDGAVSAGQADTAAAAQTVQQQTNCAAVVKQCSGIGLCRAAVKCLTADRFTAPGRGLRHKGEYSYAQYYGNFSERCPCEIKRGK